jgi:hypothetical protein
MGNDLRDTVSAYLSELPDGVRFVTDGEWGLSIESAGWPLDVGIAHRDGLLRMQAAVIAADQIAEGTLLWWNRRIPLVRFSASQAGEVWICCDLLPDSVNARNLDRVLGLLVLAATQARESAGAQPVSG